MRTVLCFGDSNTWGFDPETQQRFPRDVRWPGRLQGMLGEAWHVVEEGLNGRTTTLDSPISPGKNGLDYLVPCLESHAPLDAVVLYLGTNDLADRYRLSPSDIAESCASLVRVVRAADCGRDGRPPPVLLVCPPPIHATGPNAAEFETAAVKSRTLGKWFADAADAVGAELLDLDGVVRYSDDDPIHLDADAHRTLAETLAPLARRLAPTASLSPRAP